jgi:hypothetical protein
VNNFEGDLAARNLLLQELNNQFLIKISGMCILIGFIWLTFFHSDMGMSTVADVYDVSKNTKLPVKWTAPEVLVILNKILKPDRKKPSSHAKLMFGHLGNFSFYHCSSKKHHSMGDPDSWKDSICRFFFCQS